MSKRKKYFQNIHSSPPFIDLISKKQVYVFDSKNKDQYHGCLYHIYVMGYYSGIIYCILCGELLYWVQYMIQAITHCVYLCSIYRICICIHIYVYVYLLLPIWCIFLYRIQECLLYSIYNRVCGVQMWLLCVTAFMCKLLCVELLMRPYAFIRCVCPCTFTAITWDYLQLETSAI